MLKDVDTEIFDNINFYLYADKYHHLNPEPHNSENKHDFGLYTYFHLEKGLTAKEAEDILTAYNLAKFAQGIINASGHPENN